MLYSRLVGPVQSGPEASRSCRARPGRFIPPALLLLVCVACSSPKTQPMGAADRRLDLSGAWELDYSQSDNVRTEFERLLSELRRQQERASPGGNTNRAGVVLGGSGQHNSGQALLGLAQMAELITEPALLEISQDEHSVQVKREGSFALHCEFYDGQPSRVENPMGSEVCGWAGHQLQFLINLPEGLTIRHVLTRGQRGERLRITTTVWSDSVTWPFTVNRVYNRYDPEAAGYRCKQTLTRGRVCTTESS